MFKFMLAIVAVLSMATHAHADPTAASPTTQPSDKATVESLARTLFAAVDAKDWDGARATLADTIQVDYADLGGAAGETSADELVGGWEAAMAGLDRTIHQPHRLAVWVAGDRASATANAIALHEFAGETWAVLAGYDMEFVRTPEGWRIDRLHLSLLGEDGDRQMNARAAEAEPKTLSFEPNENVARVGAFFDALEAGDLGRFVALWAEDGKQVMPFAPEGFPREIAGRDGIRQQYGPVADFASQRYPRQIYPTADVNIVIARYDGQIVIEPGQRYDNSYVGVWRFDDAGQIAEFTEYFSPTILATSFPGIEPTHYSIHAAGASPASGVALREVTFESAGDTLAGHLFLPPGFDETQQYPAIVVAGSWTSVKEQMPDTYASRLAAEGFVALTFDFRGWGESEGLPRQYEDHVRKIEDIKAAVGFLADTSFVEDVSGLGVCASAGYMAHATAQDERIARLLLIAPWMHDPAMTEQLYSARPGGREALLKLSREAQQRYERTGEVIYDQAASEINPMAAMYVPGGAFPYYLDPALAAGPDYPNLWAVQSWEPWLTFDAIGAGDMVSVPVHIVHSESGAVPQGAKAFIDKLAARDNEANVTWLNDFTQQDLYHEPKAVTAAVEQTAAFMKTPSH